MNLIEFSTQRRVTVAITAFTFVLFGLIALFELKVNLLPDLSYPTLTVRTEYVGAAPTEIENLITEKIEEAVGVVKGLRKLRSVSHTGQSDVTLEFAWGTDMDKAGLEVRDKLEVVRLPLDVKPPVLLRFNPATEPVMRLILSAGADAAGGEQQQLMRLRRFAEEELKKRLEPIDGVAAVKVSGGLEDEVQVLINDRRLSQLKLSVNDVIERLRQENVNISGGRIEEGSQRFLVRAVNQFVDLEQMRELFVANSGGVPVRLKDVATVGQGHKERQAIIRIDGQESVEIAIYKEGDANTVAVAEGVSKSLERQKDQLPRDIKLTPVEDQSVFIRAALSEVKKEAVLGGALAILIIFLFLRDGWSTFVIGLSLPISIVATFFFMGQLGLSLNVMSLAGLALATGMVVDDSIVVLESIAKARERGLGVLEATISGASEVSMAVVASTLTTVAVFLPLVFVQGVAGQLFKDQALTVSIALVISLAVALTLIPMLSALKATRAKPADSEDAAADETPAWRRVLIFSADLLTWPLRDRPRTAARVLVWLALLPRVALIPVLLAAFVVSLVAPMLVWLAGWIWRLLFGDGGVFWGLAWIIARIGTVVLLPYDWAAAAYRRTLPRALAHPALVLGSSAIAFLLALMLATRLGADLIPQFAQDRFEMTAKLPPGTQLRETDALVKAIQQAHAGDKDIGALYGVSGSGTRLDANPTESGENIAKLIIVLGEGYSRATEARATERLRETMSAFPHVEVKFGRPELLSFTTPLEIVLASPDLESLDTAGKHVAQLLATQEAFTDVKSTVEQGHPEIQIRFDQERAAALGVTTRQIADQIVRKVRGEVATQYSFRDRKIDVLVRAREAERNSAEEIRQLIVNPQSERPLTLSALADVRETIGPSEIHRSDQTRVAVVSANLRNIDLGTAVERVRELIKLNPISADVRLSIGGQGEELQDSLNSLLFALGLAVFLVYLVLASQFESLLHPLVIMFSVPLAMVGAVLALWLSGSPVSVVVFIGLILLVGIVVKNAIMLIDKVNQLRAEGVTKLQAISEAATSRLRPITMTTLTTLIGFAPLAFMGGEGAEVKAPMAVTVIGGLTVSTLLTLFVIPVVYNVLDRRSDAYYRERKRATHRQAHVPSGLEGEHA